jgi:hypothetical protein
VVAKQKGYETTHHQDKGRRNVIMQLLDQTLLLDDIKRGG